MMAGQKMAAKRSGNKDSDQRDELELAQKGILQRHWEGRTDMTRQERGPVSGDAKFKLGVQEKGVAMIEWRISARLPFGGNIMN